MLAGGAEELCPTEAATFDALYATSTRNSEPTSPPGLSTATAMDW